MSKLITNLPSVHTWVRKEYLCDHEYGHGEFVKGIWIAAKSIPGRAFYFETYLPDYGAMYDKLPISAFDWKSELGGKVLSDILSPDFQQKNSFLFCVTDRCCLLYTSPSPRD